MPNNKINFLKELEIITIRKRQNNIYSDIDEQKILETRLIRNLLDQPVSRIFPI